MQLSVENQYRLAASLLLIGWPTALAITSYVLSCVVGASEQGKGR